MARLILKNTEGNRAFNLDKDEVTIGRNPDNNIQVDQDTVSRYHAEVKKRGEEFYICDLGSTNGTYLNGIVVKEALLKGEDIIRIGGGYFIFDDSVIEDVSVATDAPLAILHQVGKAINKIMGENDLLELVMDMIFRVFKADRGLILLIDKNSGELVTRLVREVEGKEKVVISKSLMEHVMKEKLGLIVYDSMSDPRFKHSESIISSDIGSIMAVPMLIRDEVIGVIQVDFSKGGNRFTKGELDLLCSISDYLAIGVEEARLNEQMKKETRLRTNLERFHSPDVVNKIVASLEEKGDIGLEVEEKEATILFADICDFTPLAERLHPVEVTVLLNEYFTIMTDIIFEYGGTLDKYIGDAVMALFGVPYSPEDHADRALMTARKMQKETAIFAKKTRHAEDLRIRIGINTGRVVAGNIGSPKRMEYSVLGDTVNVASRLCGLGEPGKIILGDGTKKHLKGSFPIKEIGVKTVKGKSEGVLVHELQY